MFLCRIYRNFVRLEPNVPRTLHELSTTGQSLTVSWDAPSDGALTGYSVKLEGGDKSQNQTHGKDTRTAAFIGLTAGTKYSVVVVTVSGDQQSAEQYTLYTSKHDTVYVIVFLCYS